MNADGSGVTQLVADGTAGDPDWSPTGDRIVYSSTSDGVIVINADGSGRRVVVPGGDSGQPSW